MLKHPVSALIRLLPALLWLLAVVYALPAAHGVLFAPREAERTGVDFAFASVLLALAVYGGVQAFREYRSVLPALRADTSVWTGLVSRRPKPLPPRRRPMPEPLRVRLRELLAALEGAGIVRSGEVVFEEVLECAELEDEYATMDLDDVMRILRALQHSRECPFANIAFFVDECEVTDDVIVAAVREFARLCGRSAGLGAAVCVEGIDGGDVVPAGRGTFPPHNARVAFDLDGTPHVVPFVMYRKNLPIDLPEGLARSFASHDRRRFVVGEAGDLTISYLEPQRVAVLNEALAGRYVWFKVLE